MLPPNIHVRTLHWCYSNDNKLQVSKRTSEFQDGGFENAVAQISGDTHDSNVIPMATPMFPGSGNTDRLLGIHCPMSGRVGNQKYMVNFS